MNRSSTQLSAVTTLVAAMAMLFMSGAAQAQQTGTPVTVVNGSFEQQTTNYVGQDPYGNNLSGWTPNGWTALDPTGEGINSLYKTPSPDGGNYWGLQYLGGQGSRHNKGGISQSIGGLTIGDTYQISFYSMANHTNDPKTTEQWAVTFGNSTQYGSVVDAKTPTTWTSDTLTFVATAATQTLTFAAVFLGATPGATPEVLNLDGIKINDVTPVPEPTSLAMLLAGGAVICSLSRRRRRRD